MGDLKDDNGLELKDPIVYLSRKSLSSLEMQDNELGTVLEPKCFQAAVRGYLARAPPRSRELRQLTSKLEKIDYSLLTALCRSIRSELRAFQYSGHSATNE